MKRKLSLKERKQVIQFAKKLVEKKSLNEYGGKNPELDKKVTNFIKGIAKLYSYSEADAVYSVLGTIKDLYPKKFKEMS